ncbi:hypothetical protein ABEB36_008302 [Hypothenemus hampei]|uniref:Uncharacterized protein n=1 Tax=Hypothenemus hampei TaxID=57062 RepID=A0ABD1ELE4_HYPHA
MNSVFLKIDVQCIKISQNSVSEAATEGRSNFRMLRKDAEEQEINEEDQLYSIKIAKYRSINACPMRPAVDPYKINLEFLYFDCFVY